MKGFDRTGKRLDDVVEHTVDTSGSMSPLVKEEGTQALEMLIGTVDVQILNKCIETEYNEVRRQAGLVVQEVLKICGRYPRNGHRDTNVHSSNRG